MVELTVAAGLACALMEFAVSNGANQHALADRSGINSADLQDQDNRIPLAKYVALMRAAKELCDDPALALHFGETNDMSQTSIVGLLGYASETMLHAYAQLNRYGRLVIEFDGPVDRFRVTRDSQGLWMIDNREKPNDFSELTESTFTRMVCWPRPLGVTQLAKALRVTHPAPAYRGEYDRIFRVPVAFESDMNAMLIDEAWIYHPIARQPLYVFGILNEHADTLLKSLEKSKSIRGRVESLLIPILHTGELSMTQVAKKMGLSRPTLYRKLKDEGVRYEKVLDNLRHKMALHYLNNKKVSVNQVAYLIGFSNPSAFSHAFKRWTGRSPSQRRAD